MKQKKIDRCRDAWYALEHYRGRRRICKQCAIGDGSIMGDPDNLVRQYVKSFIGRYRYLRDGQRALMRSCAEGYDKCLDLDVASLRELLISGLCANRRSESGSADFVNINPERLFFERFERQDANDVAFIGELHDYTAEELLMRFGGGDMSRMAELLRQCRGGECHAVPCVAGRIEFDAPANRRSVRVVEVWERVTGMRMLCHDTKYAECFELPYAPEAESALSAVMHRRSEAGEPELRMQAVPASMWRQSWLLPDGQLLQSELREVSDFPYTLLVYPMVDGEAQSPVADVLPLQRQINRLGAMLERIIDHSAKGVLLFPTDQLPDGFTWQEMRRIWADPGGIIPYTPGASSSSPQQVNSTGWSAGAAEMFGTQLQLFSEVSGMSAEFRGRQTAHAGAEAARLDAENANIAMLDLMAAFSDFLYRRNASLKRDSRL